MVLVRSEFDSGGPNTDDKSRIDSAQNSDFSNFKNVAPVKKGSLAEQNRKTLMDENYYQRDSFYYDTRKASVKIKTKSSEPES